jgi:hypothetical protein
MIETFGYKNMVGNETVVCCCFCGQSLNYSDAVHVILFTREMDEERQQLFAHKKCLLKTLAPAISIHPDLSDVTD